jgi:uncharacterized protein YdhG (YjbR/CyaY superfamily)
MTPTIELPKLAAPAQRALASAGISDLKQLSKYREAEVAQLHGMGPNALDKLRAALKAQGLSFKAGKAGEASKQKKASPVSRTDKVDEYMAALKHPLKKETQALRDIIKGVNKNITEEVKWNAPSFSYKGEYLVTFNLRTPQHVHLVFHNPLIPKVKSTLLEGDYVDRRMVYFVSMQDVKAKKELLEKVLKDLIKLID